MKSIIMCLGMLSLAEKPTQPICVLNIRQEVKYINSISKFKIVSIDNNNSNEGGNESYYFYNNNLFKVISKSYGETGQRTIEYYYRDKNLIFTFAKTSKYLPNTAEISCSIEIRNYYVNNTRCHASLSVVSPACQFIESDFDDLNQSKYFILFIKKNPKSFYNATHQF